MRLLPFVLTATLGLAAVPAPGQTTQPAAPQPATADTAPAPAAAGPAPDQPAVPAFGIHGSNTIGAELMPRMVQEYAAATGGQASRQAGAVAEETTWTLRDAGGRPTLAIELHSHGSGTSASGLASGAAQIGMSSRPIKGSEEEKLAAVGHTAMRSPEHEHILALDGLLVLVSPDNPVEALSLETVARIFAGEITDWSEVGGAPGPIALHARDDKSGTYDTFDSLVLSPFKRKISPQARRYESNAEISDNVANDPNAIGFGGFAFLRNAKALAISSDCGLVSPPTVFGVKTEEYPLARRLYLYTTDATGPEARAVLDFALSDDAQEAVTDIGFIDQAVAELPFDAQGRRIGFAQIQPAQDIDARLLREAIAALIDARRLSVTFRFETGSTELDGKGQRDVQRLVRRLAEPDMAGREVIVAGFTDSVGAFGRNRVLAQRRAEAIAAAIRAADARMADARLTVAAYSELMPIACNTDATGQGKNRRVEIWVR